MLVKKFTAGNVLENQKKYVMYNKLPSSDV